MFVFNKSYLNSTSITFHNGTSTMNILLYRNSPTKKYEINKLKKELSSQKIQNISNIKQKIIQDIY